MAQIVLDNVTKLFGHVAAVNEVNLKIHDGEFFALLGPSGCGKTTTLRMIAGLETPTTGSIFINQRDVTELPPRVRDVAMVFQDYALYPHMTLLDNIGYPLKVRGVGHGELRARVTEAARSLNIDHLLDRRPSQLSGGQQQRAAVARAIVHHAQVFLFDEPLSNLDAKLRVEARGFLKYLQHELGVTTIYVTHDQAEAMALADRIAIMDQGRVIQVGAPLEVYRRPQTVFVAGFLGSPPMNLLTGRIDLAKKQILINCVGLSFEGFPCWNDLVQQAGDGEGLILGVRPEHITLYPEQTDFAFPGDVYVTQPLGAESLVNLQVGDEAVSVRLFTDEPPRLSGRIWIRPDPERIFFYRSSGELIATASS
ncbi:MAG: ABC transporter ATP-binding protein [Ardenticatenaceae bacterium]|nr:ABC transporter ATP-binding protein [Ardenticatenaceae bacterium]HBY96082.1 sugar ABC transporter ATP-binding protein [Chloroflexota bacterium]